MSNECPQRKAVALVEEESSPQDEGAQQSEEEYKVEGDTGEQLSCVLQRILLAPKTETHPQRHALFRTRCTISGKVCNVIINSGSSENVVSTKLVQALNLQLDPHPNLYKIGWIKKGGETQISST